MFTDSYDYAWSKLLEEGIRALEKKQSCIETMLKTLTKMEVMYERR